MSYQPTRRPRPADATVKASESHPVLPVPSAMPPDVAAAPASARFGKFVRTARLGSGGMGEVWKAWDTELGRWIALKFLKTSGDETEIARFVREARTAAKLAHANIAAVYEVGFAQDRHYIAMQLVDGVVLKRLPKSDVRRLASMIRDAARAVDYAHGQGVVHRDLKPENLMVGGPDGRLFVMDFGLARSQEGASELSVSGAIVGTPGFMPPEQARGGAVDRRSDVYALGATLFAVTTGQPPFRGANVYTTLKKVLEEEPALPRSLNRAIAEDLQTIILKCMEKDPADRYASASDLADDLDRWLNDEVIEAHPPSSWYRLKKLVSRRRTVVLPAAGAVLLALLVAIGMIAQSARTSDRVAAALADAEGHERAGRWTEARDAFRTALALEPGHPEAASSLARIEERIRVAEAEDRRKLAAASRREESLKRLETARTAVDRLTSAFYRRDPDFDELRRGAEQSIATLEAVVKEDPGLALAHHLLGQAWKLAGRPDRAETSWRRAATADSRHAPARFALAGHLLASSYMASLVEAPEEEDLAKESARFFEEGLAMEQTLAEPARLEAAKAMLCHARGDLDGLAALLSAAMDKYGEREGMEDVYWLSAATRRAPADKLPMYEMALKICPNHLLALLGRSDSLQELGRAEEALRDLERAVRAHPGHPVADYNLGVLLEESGRLDHAEAAYSRALDLAPAFRPALLGRGRIFRKQERWKEAVEAFTRLLERDPKDVEAWIARAVAHRRLQNAEAALSDYSEALKVRPDSPEALFNRGVLLRDMGNPAEARADFEAALKAAPEDWPHRARVEASLKALPK